MAAFFKNTKTFFKQTSAPTGWTKITTGSDDYTLRVISGSTGNTISGLNGASTVLVDSAWPGTITSVTGSTADGTADLPSHQHSFSYNTVSPTNMGSIVIMFSPNPLVGQYLVSTLGTTTSGPSGGGGVHNHSISSSGTITGGPTGFGVTYVDFILASKD